MAVSRLVVALLLSGVDRGRCHEGRTTRRPCGVLAED
jgi:hypothetical protein